MTRTFLASLALLLLTAVAVAQPTPPPTVLPSWCAPVDAATLPEAFTLQPVQTVTLKIRMGAERPEDAVRIAELIVAHMTNRPFYVSDDDGMRPVLVSGLLSVKVTE